VAQTIPPERFAFVRYEDLILDPEPTLREVCRFADLDFEPAMLAFHEHADQNVQGWELEIGAHTKLLRPMQSADVERWREERSPAMKLRLAEIEALTSELMPSSVTRAACILRCTRSRARRPISPKG